MICIGTRPVVYCYAVIESTKWRHIAYRYTYLFIWWGNILWLGKLNTLQERRDCWWYNNMTKMIPCIDSQYITSQIREILDDELNMKHETYFPRFLPCQIIYLKDTPILFWPNSKIILRTIHLHNAFYFLLLPTLTRPPVRIMRSIGRNTNNAKAVEPLYSKATKIVSYV